MSKLDDIIEDWELVDWQKQQIKDLFKELIGEDETSPTNCCDNEGGLICWKESKVNRANELRAELRQKVDEL